MSWLRRFFGARETRTPVRIIIDQYEAELAAKPRLSRAQLRTGKHWEHFALMRKIRAAKRLEKVSRY